MKKQVRIGCFETNSSSAHTVTYQNTKPKIDYPKFICVEKAKFDYCGDIVKGYQAKANYLWEIITQASGNYRYAMRFVEYLAQNGIQVRFEKDWVNEDGYYEGNLPYDDNGEELLKEYLHHANRLLEFLFNDDLIVKLYEG